MRAEELGRLQAIFDRTLVRFPYHFMVEITVHRLTSSSLADGMSFFLMQRSNFECHSNSMCGEPVFKLIMSQVKEVYRQVTTGNDSAYSNLFSISYLFGDQDRIAHVMNVLRKELERRFAPEA